MAWTVTPELDCNQVSVILRFLAGMKGPSVSDYSFFSALLRFVATKTASVGMDDPRGRALVAELHAAAVAVEDGPELCVTAENLELAARAFAGFAAFLQKQILPEAVAHGHGQAEAQLRWAVDVAMGWVSTLLTRAALEERGRVNLDLPPPPAA